MSRHAFNTGNWWKLLSAIILCGLLMAGCGLFASSPHSKLRETGASIQMSDNTDASSEGDEDITEFRMTPTTNPAPLPPGTPTSVKIDDKVIPVVPGHEITYTHHSKTTPAKTSTARQGSAQGSLLESDGDVKGQHVTDAPVLDFGNMAISGPNGTIKGGRSRGNAGGSSLVWESLVATFSAASWIAKSLAGIGVLCLVAALIYVIAERMLPMPGKTDWVLVGTVVVAGLTFIAGAIVVDEHPMLCATIILLGVVGAVGFFVWRWAEKDKAAFSTQPATNAEEELKKLVAVLTPATTTLTPKA